MIMSIYKEEYKNVIAVTNRKLSSRPFLEQMKRVCKLHPRAVILREKDLSEEEYAELAVQILTLCKQYQVPCMLHTSGNSEKIAASIYSSASVSSQRKQRKSR